ncbi:MAG TPA: GTPase, partial [Vampirovibrionales bacterium]
NALTNSDVLVEDKLFATLDPTIREVKKPMPFLLSDTVGFIQKLPTTLVNAFRGTLEEIVESDLIVLVLDASHPNRLEHLKTIEEIFASLSVHDYPKILAFNKIDLVSDAELALIKQKFPQALFVSAQKRLNLDVLLDAVKDKIDMP